MQEQPLKLPFGLRDGVLHHVQDVPQGASCGCTCPGCGSPLIARKGNRNVHHFAHAGADCGRGVETALHRVAKEAIESARELWLPAVQVTFGSKKSAWTVAEPGMVRPDSIRLESRIGGVVPDVVLTVNGRDLLVEICVTHAVNNEKLAKIRSLDLSVLEISIGHLPRDLPFDQLRSAVVCEPNNRKWLSNARATRVSAMASGFAREMPVTQLALADYVYDCPISARRWLGKAYANPVKDCLACEYCFDAGKGGLEDGGGPGCTWSVMCLGHSRISSYEDLQARRRASAPRRP